VNRNDKTVALALIGAAVLLVVVILAYSLFQRNNQKSCPDGSTRIRINSAGFETQYSTNTYKLEARLKQDETLSAELGAAQLQQMSEGIQLARLHMQALTEGYNACAVGVDEFNESRNRYQRMEDIARQIDTMGGKDGLANGDRQTLARLVAEYIRLSHM
jgi:hypothetical protein